MDFSTTDRQFPNSSVTTAAWHIDGGTVDTASPNARSRTLDNFMATAITASTSGSGSALSDSVQNLVLGTDSAFTRGFDGEICRVMLWQTALSDARRAHVAAYLRERALAA